MSVRNQKLLFPILLILIIYILESVCQVGSEDVRKVTGYIGKQVVLKLDVDPTWKLTTIQWSIYKNFTYIATFQEGRVSIFRDRLVLNTTSGDLTIEDLMPNDALEYKVYLENNRENEHTICVQLSVQEQVSKPNIALLHSFLDAEKCVISLKCSSLSSTISLSWKHEHGFNERFCSDSPNVTKESVMWTSLRTNRDVMFTCIATDGTHNELNTWSGKCQDSLQKLNNCSQECATRSCVCTQRGIGTLFVGLLGGAIVGIVGVIIYLQHNGSNLVRPQCAWFSLIFCQHTRGEEDSKENKNTRTEDKPLQDPTSGPEAIEEDKQEDN